MADCNWDLNSEQDFEEFIKIHPITRSWRGRGVEVLIVILTLLDFSHSLSSAWKMNSPVHLGMTMTMGRRRRITIKINDPETRRDGYDPVTLEEIHFFPGHLNATQIMAGQSTARPRCEGSAPPTDTGRARQCVDNPWPHSSGEISRMTSPITIIDGRFACGFNLMKRPSIEWPRWNWRDNLCVPCNVLPFINTANRCFRFVFPDVRP